MTNMSVQNGTCGGPDELDLIDEYINTQARPRTNHFVLPGPPPPPPDPDSECTRTLQELSSPSNGPVLVSRGTAPQQHQRTFPQPHHNHHHHHPMRGSRGGGPRSACGRGGGVSSSSSGAGARQQQRARSDTEPLERLLDTPQLVVTEQPKERGMRFRYECEGRSAGSILGASSSETNKTLPSIEIQGPIKELKGVTVTVSLVTKDVPYRPHPHCLVGKDCSDGICVIHLNPHNSRRHSFSNLGIQCVRRKELDLSLKKRRDQKIDPFNTGQSKSIEDMDMNVVRLCFQCELERNDGERIHLSPIISNPIFDKKATTTSELKITRLNVVKGPCTGKTEIYMLCDKVQKDDIEIIFGFESWEAKAEFAQTDVHRQIAIVFKSPPYQDQDIYEEVEVNVFLRRLSDRMDSEPVKFTYTPSNPDPYGVNRKRKIKPDIKFSEGCNVRAESGMGEPASASASLPAPAPPPVSLPHALDPFSYTLDTSFGMGSAAQDDLAGPGQPMQSLADFQHILEGVKQEDPSGSLDTDTMNMLSTVLQMLDPTCLGHSLGLSSLDDTATFGMDGGGGSSFPGEDPFANMNMSCYTDMQFGQLVGAGAGQQHTLAPSIMDLQPTLSLALLTDQGMGDVGEPHGGTPPQVKTEKDNDM